MAIKISGVTIIDDSRNIVSGAAATFTSNVTIGGTLTYEDVTNIDSIGIITARAGIKLPTSQSLKLGDSDQLDIKNSGNTSLIQHTGSSFLFIHGNDIALRSVGQKNYIVCDADNEVELYFNNSPKFKTTNTGVEVNHAGGGVLNVTTINATDGDYAGIVTAQGFVGGGINTLSESIFKDMSVLGGINISGVATATAFSGDGSNLTNLPVSSFFANTDVGIHTLAKVGIGTTNPIGQLDVNVGTSVTALNIEGSEGQLFSVTNNLSSGSIFAVNDITGLPSVDVNADGTIQLAPRGAGELVGIGTTVPTSKLHVVGDTLVTGVGTFHAIKSTAESFAIHNSADRILIKASNRIDIADNRVRFQSRDQSTILLDAVAGSGGFVNLYQNNNIKLQTTGLGVTVLGGTETQTLDVTGVSTFSGDLNVNSALPTIRLNDSNANDDFAIRNDGGVFGIRDITNGHNRFTINSEGTLRALSRMDFDAGIHLNAGDLRIVDIIKHRDDDDTKIRFPAADTISFETAGSERARFTDDGLFKLSDTPGIAIINSSSSTNGIGTILIGKGLELVDGGVKIESTNTGPDSDHLGIKFRVHDSQFGSAPHVTSMTLKHDKSVALEDNLNVAGISTFSDDVNLPNDKKVKFGSFGFQIYQNTSNSNNAIIQQSASGQFLRLITNGGQLNLESNFVQFRNSANTTTTATFDADGATTLFHNSNPKFLTASTGAEVVGILTATSIKTPKYEGDADRNIIMGCCAGIAITDTVTDACRNVIIGCSAGRKVCTGSQAVIIGGCAGHELINAGANIILGEFAACKMCCGFNNVVIGKRAGMGLTGRTSCSDVSLGANSNVFIGSYTGRCTRRECNTFVGPLAGMYNSGGQHNTFIGVNAGKGPSSSAATNTGTANVYVGSGAGINARGGSYNIAIGRNTGIAISTGGNNILLGCGAGISQISAFNNIFVGNLAGGCVTTGAQNIFMGQQAGRCNISGGLKIAIGDNAGECGMGASANGGLAIGHCTLRCDTCGSGNVAIGNAAGMRLTCGQNIFMGQGTGVNATAAHGNTFLGNYVGGCFKTGQKNTFVGCQAGFGHTVGNINVMLGACSGPRNCGAVGDCNVFIGGYTASAMCCGVANVLIGTHAGQCIRNAFCNIFLGRKSGLGQTSGCFNFYVGNHAGPTICGASGSDNIGLGRNTMRNGGGTAQRNIAIGLQAGNCVTGNYNIFFGCGAGELVTSGSRNIIIGCGVDAPSATGNRQLAIGEGTGRWIAGDNSFNVTLAGIVTATAAGSILANDAEITSVSPKLKINQSGTSELTSVYNNNAASLVINDTTHGAQIVLRGQSPKLIFDQSAGGNGSVYYDSQCLKFYQGMPTGTPVEKVRFDGGGINVSGAVTATAFVGDGSGLTNISASGGGGFSADDDDNIFTSNTCSGCNLDGSSGCNNIFLGQYAGKCVTSGDSNLLLGHCAGKIINSGSCNIIFGKLAGLSITTGQNNIAIGNQAIAYMGDARNNIAIGCCALTMGGGLFGNQIAIGNCAGRFTCETGGSQNILIGSNAGKCLTRGLNIALGGNALGVALAACRNIVVGTQSLNKVTTGCFNTTIGNFSSSGTTTGQHNITIGDCSGPATEGATGCHNFFGGHKTGNAATSGGGNIAVGREAGLSLTTGSCNIFLGDCAGANTGVGSSTILIGSCAGKCLVNTCATSGTGNIFLGENAGKCATTGIVNVLIGKNAGCCLKASVTTIAIGSGAGKNTCAANDNVFIGTSAGLCNKTGATNVMIGNKVGRVSQTGSNNIFIGQFAGCNNNCGASNVYIGNCSGYKTQGHNNVMMGLSAGFHRCDAKSSFNVLIGRSAGDTQGTLSIMNFDVMLGYTAGRCYTGSCSIGLGHSVRMPITDGMNQLAIGQLDNYWITGNCDYNVGIGTTNPTSKLTVVGNTCVAGIATFLNHVDLPSNCKLRLGKNNNARTLEIFHQTNTGFYGGGNFIQGITGFPLHIKAKSSEEGIAIFPDSTVILYHNGDERLRTCSTGIGVAGITSTTHLNVTGVSTFAGTIHALATGDNKGLRLHTNSGVSATANVLRFNTGQINGFTFNTNSDGSSSNERMTIDGSGRIGLGIANPGDYHSSYNRVVMGRATDSGGFTIVSASSFTGNIAFANGTSGSARHNGLITYSHSNNIMSFGTGGGVERLRISNTGATFAGNVSIAGTVSIGGTLTYEDVTNVDSVGLITARAGVFIPDNQKLQIGNEAGTADFEIAHDTNNTVFHNKTGSLFLKGTSAGGNAIHMQPKNNESSAIFHPDGKVELFNDNVIKFATSGIGATIYSDSADLHIRSGAASATGQGQITFKNVDGNSAERDVVRILGASSGNGGYGELKLQTAFNNSLSTRLTIEENGTSKFTGIVSVSSAEPQLTFHDTNHSPFHYHIKGDGGALRISDSVNGNRLSFNASGSISIHAGTTVFAGAAQVTTGLGANGDITIEKNSPSLFFKDNSGAINNYSLNNNGGVFRLKDDTSGGVSRFTVSSSGVGHYIGTVSLGSATFGSSSIVRVYGGAGTVKKNALMVLNPSASVTNRGAGVAVGAIGNGDDYIGTLYARRDNSGDNRGTTFLEGKDAVIINTNDGTSVQTAVSFGSGISTFSSKIALPDDKPIQLGTKDTNPDGELVIEHCSSNVNFIRSPSNRTLQIFGDGGLLIRGAGNQNIAHFIQSSVKLYQNQGIKLETKSTGVEVVGVLTATSIKTPKYDGDEDLNIIMGRNAGIALTDTITGGCCNVLLGHCSGHRLCSGHNNVMLGSCAGANVTCMFDMVAIGREAGRNACCVGGTLVAIGLQAGKCNDLADGNTFIGGFAGRYISGSGGAYNFFGGYGAGQNSRHGCSDSPTGGSCNVALGFHAFGERAGGSNNVFIGRFAGAANSTGANNFAANNGALMSNVNGGKNFAGGYLTLTNNITGGSNVAIGPAAMRCNISGGKNVAVGFCALGENTCGSNNIALGECAMRCHHTNGSNNFAAGTSALRENEGAHNSVIGQSAGLCNTSGCFNIAIGHNAGRCNTTGFHNISFGLLAGRNSETTSNNISIGECANYCNKAGANIAIGRKTAFHDDISSNNFNVAIGDCAFMGATDMGARLHNVAIGIQAGGASSAGSGNIFLGCYAGYCNGGGGTNVYMNRKAGYFNKTGHDNVMIGDCAGFCGTSHGGNVFIGKQAGYCNNGDNNVAIGVKAGCCLSSGSKNVAIGSGAGQRFKTGSYNFAFGNQTMTLADVSGSNNIAMGNFTGRRIATGNGNIFLGSGAGRYVLGGHCNIAIGQGASYCLSGGCCNIAIGSNAGSKQTSSTENISIGSAAGSQNCTGSGNVAVGHSAGYGVRGSNNISIGATAGPGDALTTAVDNIFIGRQSGAGVTSAVQNIYIGVCAGHGHGNSSVAGVGVGTENVFVGSCAGRCVAVAKKNVFVGGNAGQRINDGSFNVAVGFEAGCCMMSGNSNVAVGAFSAYHTCSGGGNVFMGLQAALCATTSSDNVIIGNTAGKALVTGSNNVAVGKFAGCKLNNGGSNVLMGNCAGYCITGFNNVMLGMSAGFNRSGSKYCRNILIGQAAGSSAGTLAIGNFDILIGHNAGCNYTGSCSIGIGHSVCLPIANGMNQLAIGQYTRHWITGNCDFNVGIGTTNALSKLHVNVGSAVSAFNIEGSEGQLFSVTNNLSSGSIFAVNDITGLPSIDVNADGTIQLAPRGTGELVGIGTTVPTAKLDVVGDARVVGTTTFTTGTNKHITFSDAEHDDLSDEGAGIIFSRPSDGSRRISGIFQHTNQSLGMASRGGLTFHTGGSSFYSAAGEKLRIDDSGKLNLHSGTIVSGTLPYAYFNVPLQSYGGVNLSMNLHDPASEAVGAGGGLGFSAIGVSGNPIVRAAIRGNTESTSSENGFLSLHTRATGVGNTERLRIDSSGRVLIGHNTSEVFGSCNFQVQVTGTSFATSGVNQNRFQNGTSGPSIILAHSRSGTKGSHTILQNGDEFGKIRFYGSDGNDFNNFGAEIRAQVDGTPGNNDMPGRIKFSTTPDGGTTAQTRMTIKSTGRVGINTLTPTTQLDVNGSVHTSRFFTNKTSLDTTITFPESGGPVNGGVFGPYTIDSGVTLTISSGSTFKVL